MRGGIALCSAGAVPLGPANRETHEVDEMADEGTFEVNEEELTLVADVLMGAAHADGDYDGREAMQIRKILAELVGEENMPAQLGTHLKDFDIEAFDLDATVSQLHLSGPDDRRGLLALVARVTDADQVHDLQESDYIRAVAEAIGAEASEYEDLTVELVWLSGLGEPPPIPE